MIENCNCFALDSGSFTDFGFDIQYSSSECIERLSEEMTDDSESSDYTFSNSEFSVRKFLPGGEFGGDVSLKYNNPY